ncbi:phage tail fiber protein [Streptosporangium sandarakinum]
MPGTPNAGAAADALDYFVGRAVKNPSPYTTYVALLTSEPPVGATMAQMAEVSTPGYSRQPATWAPASATVPSATSNTNLLTFGPVTADMTAMATHCALVTSLIGTSGEIREVWRLDAAQQAVNGQALQMGTGKLTLSMG